jgi:hypothetical protein
MTHPRRHSLVLGQEVRAMTASFNALDLPRHISLAREGRGNSGVPHAALVCSVCAGEEETTDTPEALHELARRFVPRHMDCTPADIDEP